MQYIRIACVGIIALALAACGSDSTTSSVAHTTTHGTLEVTPPLRIASLDASDFQAQLAANIAGQQLLQVTGHPTCGVDFYYLQFWTLGAAGETTESSGALMVPTGAAPGCSGPRPILLYAHGTQTDKLANIADITNPSNAEGALIAAMFAAQGYIVVAPNYAGYDISTLGYHPFLNAAQQSGEMLDILAAARSALPRTFSAATSDNGQLFLTGYSEGGHVALATLHALEAGGVSVTAAAGMSGPYALEAFGDTILFGAVDLGSTQFAPLLTTSYQHAYGNIYTSTSDIYSPTYATGIDTLLPSATPIDTLFTEGKLPQTALFDSTTPTVMVPNNAMLSTELTAALGVPMPPAVSPSQAAIYGLGFGASYLFNNSVRVSYAEDAAGDPDGADTFLTGQPASSTLAMVPGYPLRKAFYLNDLRYVYGALLPSAPLLMCGGENDPTVYFSTNTGTMANFWSPLVTSHALTVLDVDPSGGPSGGPFAAIQSAFQGSETQELAYLQTAAGGGLTPTRAQQQLVESYHSDVAPFCSLAVRSFFSSFVAE